MNENKFVWTDELVKEFANSLPGTPNNIEKFKQSKLAPPPVKERNEVYVIKYIGESFITDGWKKQFLKVHEFLTNDEINSDKFPAIKQAIEAALNEDTLLYTPKYGFGPVPSQPTAADTGKEQEWEIQCLVVSDRNYWVQKSGLYSSQLFEPEHTAEALMAWAQFKHIHSVKRISDNCVFTVGDEVEYGSLALNSDEMKVNITIIDSFKIHEGRMWAFGKGGFYITPITHLRKPTNEKLPPKEQSKPVTDNSDIPILSYNDVIEATSNRILDYDRKKLLAKISEKLKQ